MPYDITKSDNIRVNMHVFSMMEKQMYIFSLIEKKFLVGCIQWFWCEINVYKDEL